MLAGEDPSVTSHLSRRALKKDLFNMSTHLTSNTVKPHRTKPAHATYLCEHTIARASPPKVTQPLMLCFCGYDRVQLVS